MFCGIYARLSLLSLQLPRMPCKINTVCRCLLSGVLDSLKAIKKTKEKKWTTPRPPNAQMQPLSLGCPFQTVCVCVFLDSPVWNIWTCDTSSILSWVSI